MSTAASLYKTRQIGAANTLEYRLFIESKATGKLVSPFHDIPLFANADKTVFNMVVEIPRWSNAKLEISKEQAFNPIKQDVKKGKLRFVKNCFPYHGYIWNYGALPQTWEDPTHSHPDTGAVGDNDPIDVIEIGEAVGYTGQVKQVKALGVMALLDEGETDWKVVAIDVTDPLAEKLNDIADVETHFPGLLQATRDWFRIYKIPDGKPENQFAFNGDAKNMQYCLQVIDEVHEAWRNLITGKVANKTEKYEINTANTEVKESGKYLVDDKHEVYKSVPAAAANLPAHPIDKSVDKWYFVSTL